MTTTVVNLRDFREQPLPADVVLIDRRTRWENPAKIGERWPGVREPLTRSDTLTIYRGWLAGVLGDQPDFLEPLRGKRLACWCKPLPCHGDVIVELLEAA